MANPRERIQKYVAAHPGQHFSELKRTLDLSSGQVQHHLRVLREEGTIVKEPYRGRTHYYTSDYDPYRRKAIAILRRETARSILFYLLEHGETEPQSAADALGIARSTLEWHLDQLIERSLARKRRYPGNRITLVVPDPAETLDLLGEITPSLSDRMLDQFTGLVDDLISE